MISGTTPLFALGITGGPDDPQTIYRQNTDPSMQIAGTFIVPNTAPVESNWLGVFLGAGAILFLSVLLTRR